MIILGKEQFSIISLLNNHVFMNALQDRYLDPLTDFGFKKLFGTEPNKELLIDFLNQLLPTKHRIVDLSYANSEHLGKADLNRKAIFDLYCLGESGQRFIVELQKAKQNYFKHRSIYYSSFPIQEQAKKGDWNYRLDPVYTVGILDFVFEEHRDDQEPIHLIELKNQDCEVFYEELKFIYIELPKFKKAEAELETQLDKWLYVLRHLSRLSDRPTVLEESIFNQLFEVAEFAKFDPLERVTYESSLKYYRDMNNVVNTAKAEGMNKRNQEIALQMKQAGETEEKISRYTGLSKAEIDQL